MNAEEYKEVLEKIESSSLDEEVKTVIKILFEKKAENIVVLELKEISDVTDYMIICSGGSTRQNKALADEIKRGLKKDQRRKFFNFEGTEKADWVLLDYVNFIVHIFLPEHRDKFSLEKLWMDAKKYQF